MRKKEIAHFAIIVLRMLIICRNNHFCFNFKKHENYYVNNYFVVERSDLLLKLINVDYYACERHISIVLRSKL